MKLHPNLSLVRQWKGGKSKSTWVKWKSSEDSGHLLGGLVFLSCVLSRFNRIQLFGTLCTEARQVPLSMGFSKQEYWSEWPCPPPDDLPDPWTEPTSPASSVLQADSLPLSYWGSPLYSYLLLKHQAGLVGTRAGDAQWHKNVEGLSWAWLK